MKSTIGKIQDFLDKIDFFTVLLFIVWSVGVVWYSVVVDCDHMVFTILRAPFIRYTFLVLCVLAGVGLQKWLFADPDNRGAVIGFQLFYFGIPILVGLLRPIVLERWYRFGGFMPGLAALGLEVFGWIWGGVALVGALVFWAMRITGKKRAEKGKEWNYAFWRKLKRVLNIGAFWIITIVLVITGVCYCTVMVWKAACENNMERNEVYLEERIGELTALSGGSDPEEAVRELLHDGFNCSYFIKAVAENDLCPLSEICGDLNKLMTYGKLSEDVFRNGIADYQDFTKSRIPQRNVEMINQEIVADVKGKTVSVSVELSVYDMERESMYNAYMITTFDEQWNIVEVSCSDERLK